MDLVQSLSWHFDDCSVIRQQAINLALNICEGSEDTSAQVVPLAIGHQGSNLQHKHILPVVCFSISNHTAQVQTDCKPVVSAVLHEARDNVHSTAKHRQRSTAQHRTYLSHEAVVCLCQFICVCLH